MIKHFCNNCKKEIIGSDLTKELHVDIAKDFYISVYKLDYCLNCTMVAIAFNLQKLIK